MNSALIQTIKLGIKSLLVQKMRAGLAALGIFIGTTTVIWLAAVGEGVSHPAQQQILDLGASNLIVRPKDPNARRDHGASSPVAPRERRGGWTRRATTRRAVGQCRDRCRRRRTAEGDGEEGGRDWGRRTQE